MTVDDNTPDTGTETDETQAPDNPYAVDWYDPEEDQDTVAPTEAEATEDGEEEPADAEPVETEPVEAPADAVVSLPDGTKVPITEVLKGYQRQADYTRKSQELAASRKATEAVAQRIESINETFIDHLSSLMPPEPNPALALSNPNAYTAQKAQYDAARAQVQKLIEIGQQSKQIKETLTAEDRARVIADENAKLAERFPEVVTKQGREKFFTSAAEAAQEMGFTMDELGAVTDHRVFAMAHFAKIGMEAMKARTAAKAKAQAAPPVTPRKPGQPVAVNRNADAMKKLARSGSIRDALKLDWD